MGALPYVLRIVKIICKLFTVLDTGAWLANWLMAIGLYAGRQERPWSRDSKEPLDDLPNIYIPNELTGNQIARALKLTGKEQMVIEENEVMPKVFFRFYINLQ